MPTLVGYLAAIAAGAIGWFATAFFAGPVRAFFDLRRETKRHLLQIDGDDFRYRIDEAGNAVDPAEQESARVKHSQTKAKVQDLGAQLIAFAKGETLASKAIGLLGYNADEAGRALLRYSDHLGDWGEDEKYQAEIDKALKL